MNDQEDEFENLGKVGTEIKPLPPDGGQQQSNQVQNLDDGPVQMQQHGNETDKENDLKTSVASKKIIIKQVSVKSSTPAKLKKSDSAADLQEQQAAIHSSMMPGQEEEISEDGVITYDKYRYPENSYFLFSSKNRLRIALVWLVNHPFFDFFLTLCIIVNAINMCFNDYSFRSIKDKENDIDGFRLYLGNTITSIFILEFTLKSIAKGFIFGDNCYIDDAWNKLDFVVVCTGIMGFLKIGANVGAIRAVRLLRPLRSINKIKGIRVIVTAFIASMPPLVNVGVFLCFIVVLLGTFGIHLFAGMYEWRCRKTPEPVNGVWELMEPMHFRLCKPEYNNCPEGTYCGAPIEYDLPWDWEEVNYYEFQYYITGYDQIWQSMLTVFQCMTGEGWSTMMYTMWDHFPTGLVVGFFTILILFGVFFVLNLFLAVISDSFAKVQQEIEYEEIQKEEAKKRINDVLQNMKKQKEADDEEEEFFMGKNKEGAKPQQPKKAKKSKKEDDLKVQDLDGNSGEESELSSDSSGSELDDDEDNSEGEEEEEKDLTWSQTVIASNYFMLLSLTMIMGNTFILALEKFTNTPVTNAKLETYNKMFTYIFTVEMVFKNYALGIKGYLRDGYNIFDGILVMVSLFDVIMELIMGKSTGAGVLSVFRTLRLLRVFKLATKSKGLLILLTAIMSTLRDIVYFCLLLVLYIFICSLLGMEAYAFKCKLESVENERYVDPTSGGGVSPRLNFDTFPSSLVAVFALLVNEDWNYVLYTYAQCGPPWLSYLYIGFVVVFGNFFLLQLFLAILIDNFSEASEQAMEEEQEEREKEEEEREEREKEEAKNIKPGDKVLEESEEQGMCAKLCALCCGEDEDEDPEAVEKAKKKERDR